MDKILTGFAVRNDFNKTLGRKGSRIIFHASFFFLSTFFIVLFFNPSGPDVFFIHWGPRGGETPPLKKLTSSKEKHVFFCHEVNICINSALFWCITLVSSSMLTKISDFIEKRTKFETFKKIELYASYVHQNKAKTT